MLIFSVALQSSQDCGANAIHRGASMIHRFLLLRILPKPLRRPATYQNLLRCHCKMLPKKRKYKRICAAETLGAIIKDFFFSFFFLKKQDERKLDLNKDIFFITNTNLNLCTISIHQNKVVRSHKGDVTYHQSGDKK